MENDRRTKRTKLLLKNAFTELLSMKTLNEISVKELCELADINRGTFCLHYQDIYDLLASIFLNEDVPGLSDCNTIREILECLLAYSIRNFDFLHSTYMSAGSDLVSDFFYNKIITSMISLYSTHPSIGIPKASFRNVARRFAINVSQEFEFAFKNQDTNALKVERTLKKYIISATTILYPAIVSLSKEERKRSL